MARRIVGLLTDYGVIDTYVGELKAALLSRNPELTIVDITHSVSPFNILEGAFLLYLSYRHFPVDTIFLVVVDPGVGTVRRGVALKTDRYWFVAPDNGVAYPAAYEDRIISTYMIDQSRLRTYGGETFHGRDIFAPVAAMISMGELDLLIEIDPNSLVKLQLPSPIINKNEIEATILHVDNFGNAVLNVSRKSFGHLIDRLVGETIDVSIGRRRYRARLVEAYGDEKRSRVVALWGGTGFLEVSVVEGSFAQRSGAKPGMRMKIRWH
ncbi:MAG: SAM-dependent chlorinase/fluorinase [Nitrososphaerota archaeon]